MYGVPIKNKKFLEAKPIKPLKKVETRPYRPTIFDEPPAPPDDLLQDLANPAVPCDDLTAILREVLQNHPNVTERDMMAPYKQRFVVAARKEFCYRAHKETDASYPEIGRFLGGRDHSSIQYLAKDYAEKNGLL